MSIEQAAVLRLAHKRPEATELLLSDERKNRQRKRSAQALAGGARMEARRAKTLAFTTRLGSRQPSPIGGARNDTDRVQEVV